MRGTFDPVSLERELAALVGSLEGLAFDPRRVQRFASEIKAGDRSASANRLPAPPRLAGAQDVAHLEDAGAAQRERWRSRGAEALAGGRIAIAVLNGGMATRFGGRVKGVVEAVAQRSFLEIKLAQARQGGALPLLVMNSFATHAATREFLAERALSETTRCFLQSVSLRLTPEGDLFRDASGRLSPYAPGHGDLPEALRRAGLLAELRGRGVEALVLSNVDNLGASPDPLVLGFHLEHGAPMTVELAPTLPGDVGGGPGFVDGRLQVIEGFRFPAGFDFARLPYVSTNTFTLSLDALEEPGPLTWFYVEKEVDGRRAVQMERLVGQLSAFVDARYLVVPRTGASSRFLPVKTPADLEAVRGDPALAERFSRL